MAKKHSNNSSIEHVTPQTPDPTDLYRHFDKRGNLLYVGISINAVNRLNQHKDKSWYDDIESLTVEKFATREAAIAAEKLAIQSENPLHNMVRYIATEKPIKRHHPRRKRKRAKLQEILPSLYVTDEQIKEWESRPENSGQSLEHFNGGPFAPTPPPSPGHNNTSSNLTI